MALMRNSVCQLDVDKRFSEGELTYYEQENNTIVDWCWYGWHITESSACVKIENYNFDIGKDICIDRIKNRIWKMLGYELFLIDNNIIV